MITYLFRKRTTGFSIEKLFDTLYEHNRSTGSNCTRLEMPYLSTNLWNVLKNAWYVRRQVRDGILHITGDVQYGALLCRSARTVITVHDCVTLQRGKGLKKFILWLLWYRLPLARADAVTVISEQTRKELLEAVTIHPDKLHVIPCFVDPAYHHVEKAFNITLPRILHVGTSPNKNLARVILALRDMPVMLVIVGALNADALKSLNENSIIYENHVGIDHAKLLGLYQTADIISFPSTYEGFGMPIIEGQAVGRPVLTSDAEPMKSVAGDNGALLVDPLSIDDLRSGFQSLLRDEELRERLVRCGRVNCQHYTLTSIAQRYQQLYEQLHA
jgi:glycosyltransferase involved in cell wall biosynthesis